MTKKKLFLLSWEAGNFIITFLIFTAISTLFSGWLAILLVALVCFGLSFWLYKNYLDALIASLIITEVFWAMLFLPIGPLTISAILFILSYTFWRWRNEKKTWFNLIFAGAAIILLLITSKWL
ncbi:MAG: hypothetical protein ABIG90_01275 [bacterium]